MRPLPIFVVASLRNMFCLTATHLKSKILAENWLMLSQKPSGPLCLVHAKLNTETFCRTENTPGSLGDDRTYP